MIHLFKKKSGTYTCSICDRYVNPNRIHVMLGFNVIPYNLLFFHLEHYITFLEILENCFKNRDNRKLKEFLKKSISEMEQERKVAQYQGLNLDYKKDLNEVKNFLLYQIIKRCQDKKFTCISSKEIITIQECFRCELGRHQICTRKIFFSINRKSKRFLINRRLKTF